MTLNSLLDLVCSALEIDGGSLSLDTEISSVPEWNSVGWLSIMAALDEHLNLQLPSKDIRGFKTVGDLVGYIEARVSLEK